MIDIDGKILNGEEAKELLGFWQKKLRIQDWDINLSICRSRDMEEGSQAQIEYNSDLKLASIKLRDPIDYDDSEWEQDMEISLAHELIHLVNWFVPFRDQEEEPTLYSLEEQAVESIAKALVSLRRDERKLSLSRLARPVGGSNDS